MNERLKKQQGRKGREASNGALDDFDDPRASLIAKQRTATNQTSEPRATAQHHKRHTSKKDKPKMSGSYRGKLSALKLNSKRSKLYLSFALVVVVALVATLVVHQVTDKNSPATLGDSIENADNEPDLPKESPAFDLLFPEGTEEDSYDVVRISPDEADPSYTYLDRLTDEGAIFRVTQQKVPESFDLAVVATDFQATSVIQIDETKVYHGYSEKGGMQSLLFVRDDLLVLIRSPQRFDDDTWASYIISMQ